MFAYRWLALPLPTSPVLQYILIAKTWTMRTLTDLGGDQALQTVGPGAGLGFMLILAPVCAADSQLTSTCFNATVPVVPPRGQDLDHAHADRPIADQALQTVGTVAALAPYFFLLPAPLLPLASPVFCPCAHRVPTAELRFHATIPAVHPLGQDLDHAHADGPGRRPGPADRGDGRWPWLHAPPQFCRQE